jgi:hypothetical protein
MLGAKASVSPARTNRCPTSCARTLTSYFPAALLAFQVRGTATTTSASSVAGSAAQSCRRSPGGDGLRTAVRMRGARSQPSSARVASGCIRPDWPARTHTMVPFAHQPSMPLVSALASPATQRTHHLDRTSTRQLHQPSLERNGTQARAPKGWSAGSSAHPQLLPDNVVVSSASAAW